MVRIEKKQLILRVLILLFVLFSNIAVAEASKLYKVEEGDTLWSIAEQYYDNGNFWIKIFKDNNIDLSENGYPLIYVDQMIKLPRISVNELIDNNTLTLINSSESINDTHSAVVSSKILNKVLDYTKFKERRSDSDIDIVGITSYSQDYIGPIQQHENITRFFTEPMAAYVKEIEGVSYRSGFCGGENLLQPYQEKWAQRGDVDYYRFHISECVNDIYNGHFIFRALEKKSSATSDGLFYVVVDGDIVGQGYDLIEHLIYYPEYSQLSFRAVINDDWYIVSDGKNYGPYDYVHTNIYALDGTLYSFIIDDGKWYILKNLKRFKEHDYLDNIAYKDSLSSFFYRAYNLDSSGRKEWFVVDNFREFSKWDYVDQVIYIDELESLFYRARDFNGNWSVVRIDHDGIEKVILRLDNNEDLKRFYVFPNNSDFVMAVVKDQSQQSYYEYLFSLAGPHGRKNHGIVDIKLSPNGQHYAYHAVNKNYVAEIIVDDKKYLQFISLAEDFNLFFGEQLIDYKFDINNNLVIYSREQGKIFRKVYDLNNL